MIQSRGLSIAVSVTRGAPAGEGTYRPYRSHRIRDAFVRSCHVMSSLWHIARTPECGVVCRVCSVSDRNSEVPARPQIARRVILVIHLRCSINLEVTYWFVCAHTLIIIYDIRRLSLVCGTYVRISWEYSAALNSCVTHTRVSTCTRSMHVCVCVCVLYNSYC